MSRLTRIASVLLTVLAMGLLAGGPVTAEPAPSTLTVHGLQTDYATDPLGIDDTTPTLSWQLTSPTNGARQSAYQVLVASSPDRLTPGAADVWDSGRVQSAESVGVSYAGPALQSRQHSYWAVRVWDGAGQVSGWSAPAWWEMALLNAADWQGAQWISPDVGAGRSWSDFTLDADFTIIRGAASFLFRASNADNFYMWQINSEVTPGKVLLRPHIHLDGGWAIPSPVDVSSVITQQTLHAQHHITITTQGDRITTWIDGTQVDSRTDTTFTTGTIGFRVGDSTEDSRYDNVVVHGLDGSTLFSDDFSTTPDRWFPNVPINGGQLEPSGGVVLAAPPQPDAPMLRKQFTLDPSKTVARARAYVYGLGFYELHLNGGKVGDHVLSPANTSYGALSLYDTYNIANQLKPGANAVGIWLGNGYGANFSQYGNRWLGPKEASLLLEVDYTDGTHQSITTDDSWTWSDGPITANDIYNGETYDARLAQPGWDTAGYDAAGWHPVVSVSAPSRNLVADAMPPMRVVQTLRPVRLTQPKPGVWVFDLGQNIAGWARLHVQGPAGTTVTMQTAEELKPDGTLDTTTNRQAQSTDHYTLAGTSSVETYEPRFTYHGFRYVSVTGYPGTPTLDSLDGRVVHADVTTTGTFDSSDTLLNQIWRNNRWTMLNNSMSTPTDTPVRDERTPPGMDVQAYQDASTREFAMDRYYDMYLGPTPGGGGGSPDMSQDAITLAWTLYEQYGDAVTLARAYPGMTRSIDAMVAAHPDLIWPDGSANGFGDWCPPDHGPNVNDGMGAPSAGGYNVCMSEISVVNTALWYLQTTDVAKAAQVLGNAEDATRYSDLAQRIKDAFNAHFLNAAGDTYGSGRQVTSVLPLAFGMVPDANVQAVGNQLVRTILDSNGGHLDTGIFGTRYLLDALARIGRTDVAMTALDQTSYPGFGFEINKGATTSWEEWLYSSGMETHDHGMFGGINASFYTELAGIRSDNGGYRTITIAPHVPAQLDHVSASLDTVRGRIASSWHKVGSAFQLTVTVPVNATAMVYVPSSDGSPATSSDGVKPVRTGAGSTVFSVGSGTYHFVSTHM
jgi:alpha-L-rhamnosidase